jgi:hypothetical protein
MRKTVSVFFMTLFVSVTAFAQLQDSTSKQTLLGGKINKIGLVGSLYGQYASINGGFQPSGGGSVSLLFNEKFAIGVAGYSIHPQNNLVAGDTRTRGHVAGLQLEYTAKNSKMFHVSFPLLVGMGRASADTLLSTTSVYAGSRGGHGGKGYGRDNDNHDGNRTSFVVIQPGVNLEVNVLKYLTLFGGVNYRLAVNSSSSILTNDKLSGLGFQVGIKTGVFGVPLAKFQKN